MEIQNAFDDKKYYLFGYSYNGGEPKEVISAKPTQIESDKILFHFNSGGKNVAEHILKTNILAVGDLNGTIKISAWTGKYTVLNQELFDDLVSKKVIHLL